MARFERYVAIGDSTGGTLSGSTLQRVINS